MSAPVIIYMFLNAYAQIVINTTVVTSMMFDERIEKFYSGASKKELFIEKTRDSKNIVFRSMKKDLSTNLTIVMDSGKIYSFFLRVGDIPHSIITIKDGKKDTIYRDVLISNKLLIQDGKYTTRVTNRTNKDLSVNFINLAKGTAYEFPKGSSIFLYNERVFR